MLIYAVTAPTRLHRNIIGRGSGHPMILIQRCKTEHIIVSMVDHPRWGYTEGIIKRRTDAYTCDLELQFVAVTLRVLHFYVTLATNAERL